MGTPVKWTPERIQLLGRLWLTIEPEHVCERFGLRLSSVQTLVKRNGIRRQAPAKPWTSEEETLLLNAGRCRIYSPTVRKLMPHRSEKALRLKLARLRKRECVMRSDNETPSAAQELAKRL